jgi:hypothetical protein
MKTYQYDEWDFIWEEGKEYAPPEDRIYIDMEGNPITGMIDGFYYFKEGDERNKKYVENGKVK